MTSARRAVAAAALAFTLLAPMARAQTAEPYRGGTPQPSPFLPGTKFRESDLPRLFNAMPGAEAALSQRPVPPLEPSLLGRLQRAVNLRVAGDLAGSRDSLAALDRLRPHHPRIVTELARTQLAQNDLAGVTSRLRAERAATRDSVLGSRELLQALERSAHPADAAAIALETWIASPGEMMWAMAEVLRLAPAEPRGVNEALKSACAKRPDRTDLVRGEAQLLAREGRAVEAVRILAAADRPERHAALRQRFAEEALRTTFPTDTLAACEALLSLAADGAYPPPARVAAARRAWDARGPAAERGELAGRIARSLDDVPLEAWGSAFLLEVSRTLRESGEGALAETLLGRGAALVSREPELDLERQLGRLREGPPGTAVAALDSLSQEWPPARFSLAEAQFYAGQFDSALVNYQRVAADPTLPEAMTALDRTYLLEEQPGASELPLYARVEWERWRGGARVRALSDSLLRATSPASPLYARVAMQAYAVRAAAGAWSDALAPLAFVCDSLPGDRLAPLARQRAGEAWLKLGDARRARAQFEECLARYPKAWNSAEVRRELEQLRKDQRL